MTTISNNYHNTQYSTRKSPEEIRQILNTNPYNRTPAERQWVRRVRRMLCGIATCTCGGELGERGPQEYDDAR